MALAAEAGELLELFQWLSDEAISARLKDEAFAGEVGQELADILIYLVRLADVLGVDLGKASLAKIIVNEARYPVHPPNHSMLTAVYKEAVQTRSTYRLFGMYRLLLALMVVVSHSWTLRADREDYFMSALGLGNPAVMGFFILSGFIIAEAVSTYYLERPTSFIINRTLRIVPPYLGALVLSVIVHFWLASSIVPLFDTNADIVPADLFSLHNIAYNATAILPINPGNPTYDFVDFVWAVRAEMLFYGAVFAYLYCEKRFGLVPSWRRWAVVGAVTLHVLSEYGPLPTGPLDLQFVPYFVIGILLYSGGRPLTTLACTILIAVHFTKYTQGGVDLGPEWWEGLTKAETLVPTLITIAFIPAVILLAAANGHNRFQRWDKAAGQLSYPIYLNHALVLVVILTLVGRGTTLTWQAVLVLLSLPVAYVMHRLVEGPLRQVRDRVRGESL